MRLSAVLRGVAMLAVVVAGCPSAHAMEHVTLKNGFELDCVRQASIGDRIRLYFSAVEDANFLEVAANSVVRVEEVTEVAQPIAALTTGAVQTEPTQVEMHEMLAHAGEAHNIDEDLLASVVRAESGGQVRAVSRTGARGLMQLMPGTATQMGVADSFRADQNIAGGTAYLDTLLTRYHDNVALALAAYNAGPAAVDRYRGVPPYHETQAYVSRVIREFNRRKQMALVARAR